MDRYYRLVSLCPLFWWPKAGSKFIYKPQNIYLQQVLCRVCVWTAQDLGCRYNSSPSGAEVVSQAVSLVTRTRTGSVIRVTVCPAPDHCIVLHNKSVAGCVRSQHQSMEGVVLMNAAPRCGWRWWRQESTDLVQTATVITATCCTLQCTLHGWLGTKGTQSMSTPSPLTTQTMHAVT